MKRAYKNLYNARINVWKKYRSYVEKNVNFVVL